MSAAEVIRILIVVLIVATLCVLLTAIVHARDNTDRVYLLGGAVMMSAFMVGLIQRLHQPLNASIGLLVVGLILWLVGGGMSRARRRSKAQHGRRSSA